MPSRLSPLRYPGGKARIARFIRALCVQNRLNDCHYAEPYAGGCSVGLYMLFNTNAQDLHMNDLDPGVYAFWRAILEHTEEFCRRVAQTPLTIDEWERQKEIYRAGSDDILEHGFATFFLNRTNRSGIIEGAGPIGGKGQSGKWRMDARYNTETLIKRIRRVGLFRTRIHVTNLDAIEFGERLNVLSRSGQKVLGYLDPPYFEKGQRLYRNAYDTGDHEQVRNMVAAFEFPWVVSYDATPEIRNLYRRWHSFEYGLGYSARRKYEGREFMAFSDGLKIPSVESPVGLSTAEFRELLST